MTFSDIQMSRAICAFVVRIWHKTHFLMAQLLWNNRKTRGQTVPVLSAELLMRLKICRVVHWNLLFIENKKNCLHEHELLVCVKDVSFWGKLTHTDLCIIWRFMNKCIDCENHMDRVKRIWYLSHMRAAKVQASLRIRAVSPEPPLLAHTSIESRGTVRQKTRSLVPLNGWACAVEICHEGMLEDTNSLDGAHLFIHSEETK